MKKPPKKLSTAMRIGLNDLKKVEKDPRYQVRMNAWHAPFVDETTGTRVCNVCFAGAVMAKTCALPVDQDFLNFTFLGDWDRVFDALDYARRGHLAYALIEMGRIKGADTIQYKFAQGFIPVVQYKDNPVQWRKDMFKIVHLLEKMGE